MHKIKKIMMMKMPMQIPTAPLASLLGESMEVALTSRGIGAGGVGGGLGGVAGVGALGGTGVGLLLDVRKGVLEMFHAGADPSLKTYN